MTLMTFKPTVATGHRHPDRPPTSIKGGEPRCYSLHLILYFPLPPSSITAITEPHCRAASSLSLGCHTTTRAPVRPKMGSSCSPEHGLRPHWGMGPRRCPVPVPFCPHRCRSAVDRAPSRGPSPVDPVHGFSYSKIIPYLGYFSDFGKRSLDFWEINPWSRISQSDP
jgi:hypothetical protein